ncbi:MAG TPA: hypothetical protein VI916_10685 [Acidimicrobiia bacterium]|nr:hypothetical protein [Acidimicrobiia bacterium]
MAVNERTRHQLYEAMRNALGDDPAETLMEMLPPVGWADVATKQDLAVLESTLRSELNALESSLRADIRGEINRLIFWLVPILLAYGAALVRFG